MAEDDRRDEGQEPEGAAEEPTPTDEPTSAEEPTPAGEASDAPGPEVEGAEQLDAAVSGETGDEQGADAPDEPGEERPKPKRRGKKDDKPKEDVIPGAHLEPDLVLEEEEGPEAGEFGEFAAADTAEATDEAGAAPSEDADTVTPVETEPLAREPLDLAADARYTATGKRKTAIARVILKPGDGTYTINGRALPDALPRIKLQRMARQPLEAAGYQTRLDVVARIRGGGVAAQAGALRHGVARALVEADPSLRLELKRRGFLTRDPRVKERKKAGLKKARKRPQFSKR
ncbi:MAG: 30S ribosomal protein S9 [Thermoleophilaceae bacterium]